MCFSDFDRFLTTTKVNSNNKQCVVLKKYREIEKNAK